MNVDLLKNCCRDKADSGSNICKKKTNKKNFFPLTFSKKVYVFNGQLLIGEKKLLVFK
jgi:hypothetical protein